jgi:hypothetical protein
MSGVASGSVCVPGGVALFPLPRDDYYTLELKRCRARRGKALEKAAPLSEQ